jgi:biopolymer transport protein ExbB/TolQ
LQRTNAPERFAVLPAIAALFLTVLVYVPLYLRLAPRSVYLFFCERGYYQHLSVFLVFFGLGLALSKHLRFKPEQRSLALKFPEQTITPDDALVFMKRIPEEYQGTLLARRADELFRGFARQEEIGPLVERLARNDRESLERGYTLLSWVRTLPPVLGLLGTLDGLRGGTQQLAEISGSASLLEIRKALQDFANSSATAFDTTLLGITGSLGISIAIFFLQRRDVDHLNEVDLRAEQIARRFQRAPRVDTVLQQLAHSFTSNFFQRLDDVLQDAGANFAHLVRPDLAPDPRAARRAASSADGPAGS